MRSNSTLMSSKSLPGSLAIHSDTLSSVTAFAALVHGLRDRCAFACGRRPPPVAGRRASALANDGLGGAAPTAQVPVAVSHASPVAAGRLPVRSGIARPVSRLAYRRDPSLPAFWPAACFYWRVVRQLSVRTTPTPNARKEAGIYGRDIQSNVRSAVAADECLVLRTILGADRTRTGPQVTNRPAAGTQAGPRPARYFQAGRLTSFGWHRGSVLAGATWAVGNQSRPLDRKESTRD